MRPKNFLRYSIITISLLAALFAFTTPVSASSDAPDTPVTGDSASALQDASAQTNELKSQQAAAELHEFVTSVINGKSDTVVGIFVAENFSLPVEQQPASNGGYITHKDDLTTQFALAAQYGTIGILAHNYLAGENFFNLSNGEIITVVYGDGSTEDYLITEINDYQALQPTSPYSEFIDLETNSQLSATELFYEVYQNNGDTIVLQTCIEAEGIDSWGRHFVSAVIIN